MAANRIEAGKDAGAAAAGAAVANGEVSKGGGGIMSMLPLIINVVLMPVLAYVMTLYVLVPKLKTAIGTAAPAHAAAQEAAAGGEHGKEEGKGKVMAPLSSKILVNVAGTQGTRYLLANITLVGANPELKAMVEKNDAQLRDAAASALASKTIADLEKPGARNIIRNELVSIFNGILGANTVKELYLTEFAIQ